MNFCLEKPIKKPLSAQAKKCWINVSRNDAKAIERFFPKMNDEVF